ncbi:MAG: sulfatase-like hydrolase/transferase, partial [Pseudomonadales bacterium]
VNAKVNHSIDKMVWASGGYSASFNQSAIFEPEGYLTDYYTREAIKVIEKNRHRPFFLYLAHWAIHNPLQSTPEDYEEFAHIEDHSLRVYAGMIRSLDRSVGQLVQALEEQGLTENTLILFTSDNGGAGYLGLADVNKPYRGWKLDHFEGGIHVPFMVKWPARIPAGSRVEAPVHHIDLFHTFAAAAGTSVPTDRKMDGVDLLPYITGEASGAPHDTLFWREGHQQTVWHEGWKLIRAGRPDKRWLFDLGADPTEQRNLADDQPERVASLEAMLDAHNAEQAEPLWPTVIDSPQLIDKHHLLPYEAGDEYIYWPN